MCAQNEQPELGKSNMTKQQFIDNIGTAQDYIAAGDIFQVVLSQRFERRTFADPFEIYRSLRIARAHPTLPQRPMDERDPVFPVFMMLWNVQSPLCSL